MDGLPGCFFRSQHDGYFLVRPLLTPGPVFLKGRPSVLCGTITAIVECMIKIQTLDFIPAAVAPALVHPSTAFTSPFPPREAHVVSIWKSEALGESSGIVRCVNGHWTFGQVQFSLVTAPRRAWNMRKRTAFLFISGTQQARLLSPVPLNTVLEVLALLWTCSQVLLGG